MRVGYRVLAATFLGVLPFGGIGCTYPSQPSDYHSPPSSVPVQGVRVLPQTIQFAAIGETMVLTSTVLPADATDQAISWESSDSTVVAVNAFGRVTARGVGAGVLITAVTHDGHHQASVNATVLDNQPNVPVDGVKVTPQSIQFSAIGETQVLTATVSPLDATDQALRWESTDTTVVAVDATGRVTARGVGAGVLVTAFTHDGQHQASVNATVNPVPAGAPVAGRTVSPPPVRVSPAGGSR